MRLGRFLHEVTFKPFRRLSPFEKIIGILIYPGIVIYVFWVTIVLRKELPSNKTKEKNK